MLARDALERAPPAVDLVAVGDFFYEAALARRVADYLGLCRACGLRLLVGDPRRAALPPGRLELLHEQPVRETDDRAQAGAVFAFTG